jgi:hypothetical protein
MQSKIKLLKVTHVVPIKSDVTNRAFALKTGDPSWDSGKGRLLGANDDNLSEVSASAANVNHDGKHSLLEFAMR